MIDLKNIISTFNSEEEKRFIAYLEKKNRRNNTKNVQLFKLLKQESLSSEDICFKIYDFNNKDAYHALRKRLYSSLIDFISHINLEEENSLDILAIKYIIASRTFLIRKQYNTAFNILNKAEVIAKEHELYSVLTEIYHTKIQYAHTNALVDLSHLISEFNELKKRQHIEEQLNIVYAKIKDITTTQSVEDFKLTLTNLLHEHDISIHDSLSFKSLYQLSTIVSISAFITKDYLNTEPFLVEAYERMTSNQKHLEKQSYYHIQTLYLLANTLFRNKKFETSLHYLSIMHKKMLEGRKKYYSVFNLKYHLLLALNLNYTNKSIEAIHILEPLTDKKHQDIESLLDIQLALIMIYIQSNNLSKAKRNFSKFYHTNTWYESKVGKEWVIKKNLMEIILHIELHNIDLVESRILSFKRQYSPYLIEINQQRAITFLKLVEIYYKTPEMVSMPSFLNKVDQSFEWVDTKQEDIFVMSFYAWLKSKMEQKDLYTVTLDLIKKAQIVN